MSEKIVPAQTQKLVDNILHAKHILVSGAGRSELMGRAFANRLVHLGLSVNVVGDITCPHTQENDLLLLISGSGETKKLLVEAQQAVDNHVKVAAITANSSSSLGKIADDILVIPAQSKKSKIMTSSQPMGALFEQASLLVCDSLVLNLMQKLGETNESMSARHADIE
ncbi:SIS domain-containing protein [Lactobacillus sp. ESL0681]|nr:6-phospho-3-hexuloisomerase [Lactobacillus sp. ESL0681]WEV40299.1 SIS domain-containing protein [Lactobacillus sp. ESL0681]